MPWIYEQETGRLFQNGKLHGVGYSGRAGPARNNPVMEISRSTGPIPAGRWKIGTAFQHDHKGPIVMRLSPVGHEAYGRTGFLIHGDNKSHDASEGCIILGPTIRAAIRDSKDAELTVVPRLAPGAPAATPGVLR